MSKRILAIVIAITGLATAALPLQAEEANGSRQDIELTPQTLKLLRAEMNEITVGIQAIAVSLAIADWQSIHDTSLKIRDSYIMAQELTPEQAKELGQALPARFQQLDAEFHQRAESLAAAASAHDAELTAFHYSRLIEGCAACHTAYAKSRFPGFATSSRQEHAH